MTYIKIRHKETGNIRILRPNGDANIDDFIKSVEDDYPENEYEKELFQ